LREAHQELGRKMIMSDDSVQIISEWTDTKGTKVCSRQHALKYQLGELRLGSFKFSYLRRDLVDEKASESC
jgi:hypothetical protein